MTVSELKIILTELQVMGYGNDDICFEFEGKVYTPDYTHNIVEYYGKPLVQEYDADYYDGDDIEKIILPGRDKMVVLE